MFGVASARVRTIGGGISRSGKVAVQSETPAVWPFWSIYWAASPRPCLAKNLGLVLILESDIVENRGKNYRKIKLNIIWITVETVYIPGGVQDLTALIETVHPEKITQCEEPIKGSSHRRNEQRLLRRSANTKIKETSPPSGEDCVWRISLFQRSSDSSHTPNSFQVRTLASFTASLAVLRDSSYQFTTTTWRRPSSLSLKSDNAPAEFHLDCAVTPASTRKLPLWR